MSRLENINPNVYNKSKARERTENDLNENIVDEIDAREIFDLLRNITDPEHPLTLEQLRVIEEENIFVDNSSNTVKVLFTPTIPHCSMATLIGLSIRVLLLRALPPRFKVTVEITPGTHASEHAVNKQLADKERVAAALENHSLISVIEECIQLDGKDVFNLPELPVHLINSVKSSTNLNSDYEYNLCYLDSNNPNSYTIDLRRISSST